MTDVSRETPPAPDLARGVFADRIDVAQAFAGLLATEGTLRGLIGPREVPRLWERHLLNCAVVTDVLGEGAAVADIGSGAGLPGLVLAIRRPDLRVTLIEPLLRRTRFLEEAVDALELDNVTVLRARAEDSVGEYDVVTSRAVAPLDRLAGWSLPLVRVGGEMVAMKGSSVTDEIATAGTVIKRLGGGPVVVEEVGGELPTPTTLARVRRERAGRR